ncbi:arylamine N-acetyltransferase family protein [Melittangium boletus]|uniref:Putative arylamine N-acetyltransferase n=1 Tax=Melittangium boletus DSM 14713 TaxID=1294270 RepID=A0A250I9T9_9BACT|nr:arylamine N-acetyltransferase [Melittangium boletus]ATB27970.1 putative arylamine N-acetyltransferase [Melittangium boletus DSM 14713]
MDLGHYLQRMGYRGPLQPTLEALRELHLQHLQAVPFENLDVHGHRSLVLDEAALFDKVVRGNRGGCCHELNGLFAALLRTLGFQVSYLSARVSTDGAWPTTPEFEHLVLEVTLEDRWLVDVGFGDCFDEPLPLVPGRWPSAGRVFRLEPREAEWMLAREEPDGDARLLYVFSRVPRRLEDFAERFQHHQSSPDSLLGGEVLCTRKTPRGRVTLRGDRLILTEREHRVERVLGPSEERDQLLLSHFGIPLGSALTPRR